MNKYVQLMKNAIDKYYTTAKNADGSIEQAKQRYQPGVASEEIEKINTELETAKRGAIDAINAARDSGIEDAKRWGKLDGSEINDGDMKLLKYDLSPDQFADMVERNKNNGTMCFILKQYADEHNRPETTPGERGSVGRFTTLVIPTVEEKIQAYTSIASNAVGVVENLTGYGWGKGVNSPFVESTVKEFGTPNAFNSDIYAAIE